EVDGAQDLAGVPVLAVGEADVIEDDLAREFLEDDGVGLLTNFVLLVHEAEDRFGGAEGLLEAVVEAGVLADGIVEGEDGDDKREKDAQGHLAVIDAVASEEQEQAYGNGGEQLHQRRTDGGDRDRTDIGGEE